MSYCTLSKVEKQIQSYFNHQNTQALAETTKKLYWGVAKNKLIPFCKLKNIEQLDESFTDYMDEYAAYLRLEDSARTTASYLTISKIFFRFHGAEIKHTYKIPRRDKQENDLKHERRWFTAEDIARCKTYHFRVKHIRNHTLVRLLIETGARVDEIAHIYAKDIDIQQKTILLSYSKTIPRPVFFEDETAIYLKLHLDEFFPISEDGDKFIFPSKNMIYKIIQEMLHDLGLKKQGDGRGPHTFRHYTATYLCYVLKMDVGHVAKLLGDTPDTISSNYLHPTAKMLHSIMSNASGW